MHKQFGGFTVKSLLDRYVLKLGLKSADYLFPRFAKSKAGLLSVCKVTVMLEKNYFVYCLN